MGSLKIIEGSKLTGRGLIYLVLGIFLCSFVTGLTQEIEMETELERSERMKWFGEAKLGIFIHWGIYAVNGITESWSFHNGYISYEDYMKQLDGFTASNYDPKLWADLIQESGARYAVITGKHHDGVALWDTRLNDLNIVERTPAGKDLISPFVKALREKDLKVGIYFSLLDWSHPDYPNFTRDESKYDINPVRQARFTEFNQGQISEISQKFDPDLYWFDGDWEQSAEWWGAQKIRESILNQNNKAIINSRLRGYGDYATPEQGLPLVSPDEEYWELCMTMNDSWGYQQNDRNYKSPNQIIRIFAECISLGGNLLLDIGPRADGIIPEEQVTILKELGKWTAKHEEAIFSSKAGLPPGYYHGSSTISADSTRLYLFVNGNPPDGQIMLEGVKNKINRIYVVGDGTILEYKEYLKPYWSDHAGVTFIDLPEKNLDEQMTVVCLLLDGKLNLSK
jgi:alpha-L-fucosidase